MTLETARRQQTRLPDDGPFVGLPTNHFAAILADPPWRFNAWSKNGEGRSADQHYSCMEPKDIAALPVASLAAEHCVLFMWATWPTL